MVNPDTATKIRTLRKAKRWAQMKLAVESGCSTQLIYMLERYGDHTEVAIEERIAMALGVPRHEIWPDLAPPTNGHQPQGKAHDPA